MRKVVPIVLIVLLVGAGTWFYFERFATTPIGKLMADPREYDGKVITIAGEVTDTASVLMFRYYKLKDGTGEIIVTTRADPPAVRRKGEGKRKNPGSFLIGGFPNYRLRGSGAKGKHQEVKASSAPGQPL